MVEIITVTPLGGGHSALPVLFWRNGTRRQYSAFPHWFERSEPIGCGSRWRDGGGKKGVGRGWWGRLERRLKEAKFKRKGTSPLLPRGFLSSVVDSTHQVALTLLSTLGFSACTWSRHLASPARAPIPPGAPVRPYGGWGLLWSGMGVACC